jgi:flavin-dependent dehydrogenase
VKVFDLAVVGGGPAGAVAALIAARHGLAVIVLEAGRFDRPRFGESLAPPGISILARLGIPALVPPVAIPVAASESAWGSNDLNAASFIFNPYGGAYHLDRARFDEGLLAAAATDGASVRLDAPVRAIDRTPTGWRLDLVDDEIAAAAVIDASGRSAAVGRMLGERSWRRDRLVGVAVDYANLGGPSTTLVEAAPFGWWYTADVPNGNRVVVLLTDPDLCREGAFASAAGWRRALDTTTYVQDRIKPEGAKDRPRVASAASARLRGDATGTWLAVGDAAMATDPLAGNGLIRAMLSGEAGAIAIVHRLLGRSEPAFAYEAWLDGRFEEYWRERSQIYSQERRWPHMAFWQRRASDAHQLDRP